MSNHRNSSATVPLLAAHSKPNTMLRRFSLFGVILVCSVFVLIVFVSHRLVTSTSFEYSPLQSIGRTIQSWGVLEEAADKSENSLYFSLLEDNLTAEILNVVNQQREKIKKEMLDYEYPDGKYNISAKSLSELVPELGGEAIKNIIITTWRSGSTFLGDILNSHPANYYHYEPLLDYGIIQIRGPPNASNALQVLTSLLNCNYTGLGEAAIHSFLNRLPGPTLRILPSIHTAGYTATYYTPLATNSTTASISSATTIPAAMYLSLEVISYNYLNYGKNHVWLFNHNTRLWDQCQQHPSICWVPEFLNPFCRLFPFQSMKVVRLRLRLIEELLNDERLNIRVLLLVRDPRGTLQSRKHRDWCPGNPDCDQAALLCADLVSDYSAALRLTEKFPTRFQVLRYEDLSINPYKTVRQLLRFYGLDFHPSVRLFLDTHTKVDVGGVSSTYRNSKSAPFHWRQDLTYREVRLIQDKCGPAMKYWGYVKAQNLSHQRVFNPVVDFALT